MPLLPPQEFGASYSNAATTDYPGGSYKDETVPGSSRDGSPLVAVTENDRLGSDYALANDAEVSFTNVPDTAVSSQRLDATNQVTSNAVWGSRYVGAFKDGFTYTSSSDVARGKNGRYYYYDGSSNYPVTVAAGVDPTASSDYELVKPHTAQGITLSDGENLQEEVDRTQQRKIIERPEQRYTTDSLASMIQTNGDAAVVVSSGDLLAFVELITPVSVYANIEAYFEFDYIYGALDTDFTFNITAVDDLDRTNDTNITAVTVERVTATVYKVTTATTATPQGYVAWSIRALASQNCEMRLKSVTVLESDQTVGSSDFSILANRDEWTDTTSSHASSSMRQRVSIPADQGNVVNCNHCQVTNRGSSEFGKPPYNIEYYVENLANQTNTAKNVKMQAGIYRPYRTQYYINPDKDMNLISTGGKVEVMCGRELPTTTWTTHQNGPTVFVRKAPYNPDAHYDASVRSNATQPTVAAYVSEDKPRSVLNFTFTPAASVAEVEAEAGRTYFDGTDLYFSFPASNGVEDSCFVYVTECDIGVRLPTPSAPINLKAFNIHVTGSKSYNWRVRPDVLGDKFISLHQCGAYASATREGFSIDRINSELIDCSAHSNLQDDFNFHDGGTSLLVNPYSQSSGDDGISHHEECIGWITGATVKYPAAAFSVPAFGASVIHENCIGYAATSGTTSGKSYTGAWAVLSGIGQDSVSRASYGEFNNCTGDEYHVVSQDSKNSEADINKAVTSNGSLSITESGVSTTVTVKN